MSDRLEEIKARASAATPGPWEVRSHVHLEKNCRCLSCYDSTGMELGNPWPSCDEVRSLMDNDDCYQRVIPWADADFISHSREDIPWLTARLSAVTAERDALAKLGMWSCKACGPHVRSRANWCERGCGSDYQEMTWVSDGQSLANVRAELSELRARVERAKALVAEYDEGDYFVHGKIQPSFYEGVDWAHKNLLAVLEGDEK